MRLRIGALATHWQLQHESSVTKQFPLLVAACATIGGRQIQTRGTLGGNIANASPAGDTFPSLAVYDAKVRLRSASGRRTLPFLEVFAGVKKTSLAAGELIESIDLDIPKTPTRQLFRKVGTRAASAISKTVAAGLVVDEAGWNHPRASLRAREHGADGAPAAERWRRSWSERSPRRDRR